ncbi:MAG: tripartite tricarboxylate transporter TctB family protein [Halodesulfurarchaeum sp.]
MSDEVAEEITSHGQEGPPNYAVDTGITLAFMIAAVVFLYLSEAFTGYQVSQADPGAALWPRAALVGMFIAGAVNLVGIYRRTKRNDERIRDSIPEMSEITDVDGTSFQFGASVVLMAVYFYSQDVLGFLVSTPIFLFIFAYVIGYRKIGRLAVFSVAVGLIVYLGFRVFLNIALPFGSGVFREVGIYVTNLF